ncbi:MAG: pyrroline-5-carboxylate reductase [Rhodospirillales bacterium]|nr:pyrroline-5-carboxylate reductase [Rhodospirillales bacterium]
MSTPLLLAGCGRMGGALLEGWLDRGFEPGMIKIVEPDATIAAARGQRHGIAAHPDPDAIGADFSPQVVVFAVKPQNMDAVAPAYCHFAGPGTVFLSIAAGKTLGYFENQLGPRAAIVRAMPNTPAAVRRGITVACPNARVTAEQKHLCGELLSAVGEVAWIADESLLDAVTALSGSGPAYVFLLAECMAQAGIEAGLPEGLANQLALATVSGSGELLRLADEPPEVLRQNVTSPGGTTAAALRVLMAEDAFQPLLSKAIAAAARRSRELAG